MRLAALTGLIRDEAEAETAADQIGLSGAERDQLLALAAKYGAATAESQILAA